MTEQEKRTEALAKRYCNSGSNVHCTIDCDGICYCAAYKFAKDAIDANYHKIPDGAVVLTREEFNKIICDIMDKNNVDDNKRIFITLLSIELEKYIFKGVSK